MPAFVISPVVVKAATGRGDVAGFECRCSCGIVMRSSLSSALGADAAAHAAYHARKAGQ